MHRITLGNTVFEGLNNAYLLGVGGGDGGDGDDLGGSDANGIDGPVTLVDTGIATADVRAVLEAGLDEAGIGVEDVDQVLLTHWHEDHAGLAGWVQEKSGATVRAHAADAPLIEGDAEAHDAMETRRRALFAEWGMPDESREELLEFTAGFDDARGEPPDVTPFEDGERLRAGDRELEAVHLPGHAAGLSGFARPTDSRGDRGDGDDSSDTDDAGEELFSGDALLPHYTPNVGGADVRVERALKQYLETLSRIVDREFAIAHPGHRDPIADPTARAHEIAVHHRDRTENVVEVLREHGPADAWTVSAHLFGSLSEIHILHGPGEAHAHLDHLAGSAVEREDGDEGDERDANGSEATKATTYRLTEGDPDLDALFPEIALAENEDIDA